MGKETEIFSTIKQILENDATLHTYINKVFEGLQKDDDTYIPDGITGYVLLSPVSCSVTERTSKDEGFRNCTNGAYQELSMVIGIVGGLIIGDEEKQVLNNAGKGILDLSGDIKNAIMSSTHLRELGYSFNISSVAFTDEIKRRKVILELTVRTRLKRGEF